jgi:hypothetical protein
MLTKTITLALSAALVLGTAFTAAQARERATQAKRYNNAPVSQQTRIFNQRPVRLYTAPSAAEPSWGYRTTTAPDVGH